ncbi:LPXTG cell wall anchor domain-containing protein, partial [Streptococcus ferus]
QQAVVSLPHTGESVSASSILSGICLVILGFLGVRRKKHA